jgi:hypothetical protein
MHTERSQPELACPFKRGQIVLWPGTPIGPDRINSSPMGALKRDRVCVRGKPARPTPAINAQRDQSAPFDQPPRPHRPPPDSSSQVGPSPGRRDRGSRASACARAPPAPRSPHQLRAVADGPGSPRFPAVRSQAGHDPGVAARPFGHVPRADPFIKPQLAVLPSPLHLSGRLSNAAAPTPPRPSSPLGCRQESARQLPRE